MTHNQQMLVVGVSIATLLAGMAIGSMNNASQQQLESCRTVVFNDDEVLNTIADFASLNVNNYATKLQRVKTLAAERVSLRAQCMGNN